MPLLASASPQSGESSVATALRSEPTLSDPQPASRKYAVASASNRSIGSASGAGSFRDESQPRNEANSVSPPAYPASCRYAAAAGPASRYSAARSAASAARGRATMLWFASSSIPFTRSGYSASSFPCDASAKLVLVDRLDTERRRLLQLASGVGADD